MKLLRLRIAGFGTLRGEYHFDPTRMTLVLDNNEQGKTTLLAAVVAGLYGLPADRRSHRPMTPLERWRPWEGGAYGVELEIECEGERLRICRDFENARVEVWNDRGQDVTSRFRDGRDDYPVGKVLLGLEGEEFQKCSWIHQGELEEVVPYDERSRRVSTLQARLERAADTRGGDSSAAAAMQALDRAARSYTSPELSSTLMVENAIRKLEERTGVLDVEIHTLEHDLETIQTPLLRLATLEEQERLQQKRVNDLQRELRICMMHDARERLTTEDARRVELQKLRQEAETLEPEGDIPPDADARLRALLGRMDQSGRGREVLRRRVAEFVEEHARLDEECGALGAYADYTDIDADRFARAAAEIHSVDENFDALETKRRAHYEALASRGVDEDRIADLQDRFATVEASECTMLEGVAGQRLDQQTQIASLERMRTECTSSLHAIDAQRYQARLPGWMLIVLGVATLAAGGYAAGWQVLLPFPSWAFAAGAGGFGLIGMALLIRAARLRGGARTEAAERLKSANEQLETLDSGRHAAETSLVELATRLGFADAEELRTGWQQYRRLQEETAPIRPLEERLNAIEAERSDLVQNAVVMLERSGGGPVEPEHLELVSGMIRALRIKQERREYVQRQIDLTRADLQSAEAEEVELIVAATSVLAEAGISQSSEGGWQAAATRLEGRLGDARRRTMLLQELIPALENQLFTAEAREELEMLLEAYAAEHQLDAASGDPPVTRTELRMPAEIQMEGEQASTALQQLRAERDELKPSIDHRLRRFHAEYPDKLNQREDVQKALEHAQRFREAVDIARETIQKVAIETHRRWAEHLNERVGEILETMGTGIARVRFGEDLDFAVELAEGRQMARGKAVLQLSAGARDQLHLAVRLAISEFLSRGAESMPFLLDDCFATSDDARAASSLRLLVEHFLPRHQVLLVTCHRSRFEQLAASDPEAFRDKVQWLDLRPAWTVR